MPDLGQVRQLDGDTFLFVSTWSGLVLQQRWVNTRQLGGLGATAEIREGVLRELAALPTGTVIEWRELPAVTVLREAPHRLDAETMEAILDMAEGAK